jgi:sugar (pentulose or hexulose) kinase
MLADFIAYRLCGEAATDLSLASRTLMLDLYQKRWDEQTLAQAGIDPVLLAPLVSAGTSLGHVTARAAALTVSPRPPSWRRAVMTTSAVRSGPASRGPVSC